MKKHRTHLIAPQMLRLRTPHPLTDLTLTELMETSQTRVACHAVLTHPDLYKQQTDGDIYSVRLLVNEVTLQQIKRH